MWPNPQFPEKSLMENFNFCAVLEDEHWLQCYFLGGFFTDRGGSHVCDGAFFCENG